MKKALYINLCEARDVLCGFCKVNECEKCIVTHLIDDATSILHQEGENGSYTAYFYEENKDEATDFVTFDSKNEAVAYASDNHWNEVVDDDSGEVVWNKKST